MDLEVCDFILSFWRLWSCLREGERREGGRRERERERREGGRESERQRKRERGERETERDREREEGGGNSEREREEKRREEKRERVITVNLVLEMSDLSFHCGKKRAKIQHFQLLGVCGVLGAKSTIASICTFVPVMQVN